MLIVSPHPDDETLGAGGLIASQRAKGADITIAAVTDGENCYPGRLGLGKIRKLEQECALVRLGVERDKIVRFQMTDSAVSSTEEQLIETLTHLVSDETQLVAPWPGDFHPDHESCGRAAREVARTSGCALTFYFFWTWHRGTPHLIEGLPLKSLSLQRDSVNAKTEALLQYQSQLVRDSDEPILSELLLAPARRFYEVFLPT